MFKQNDRQKELWGWNACREFALQNAMANIAVFCYVSFPVLLFREHSAWFLAIICRNGGLLGQKRGLIVICEIRNRAIVQCRELLQTPGYCNLRNRLFSPYLQHIFSYFKRQNTRQYLLKSKLASRLRMKCVIEIFRKITRSPGLFVIMDCFQFDPCAKQIILIPPTSFLSHLSAFIGRNFISPQ